MVYWNENWVQILEKIWDKIKDWLEKSGFYIISWPSNIGKRTVVKNLIKKIWTLQQDVIFLEDPGKKDWKNHSIKVQVDEKNRVLEIEWKNFLNLWAREITDFLSKTSGWSNKVVFIENIERLNKSSSNALLKILEEPWENVFIFASVSNKNKILDTILSRWVIINMFELLEEDFRKFINDSDIEINETKLKVLYSISWWRMGLAKRILEENFNLLDKIEEFIQLEKLNSWVFHRFSIMKELLNKWKINILIDGLIFYYVHTYKFFRAKKLIDIKNKNQANVNLENLLFDYLISF